VIACSVAIGACSDSKDGADETMDEKYNVARNNLIRDLREEVDGLKSLNHQVRARVTAWQCPFGQI